jgi:hypothetical protein
MSETAPAVAAGVSVSAIDRIAGTAGLFEATPLLAQVLKAPPGSEPSWAKPAVSILTLVVFVALIGAALYTGDTTSLAILSGVGAAMAQQVAGYYLGSSSGSAHKTALLAAAPAIPGLSPPA